MYTLDIIKKNLISSINQAIGQHAVELTDFTYPPDPTLGDLTIPCFSLAKNLGKSPAELADSLVSSLKPGKKIKRISSAGPYLNFTIDNEFLAASTIRDIFENKERYGNNETGGKECVMIEYSNANTHKEFHVGHLRNICFGDSINRLASANGYKSTPVSYINDFGIHVAKTLWCYKTYFQNEPKPENKGYFLGKIYARSSQELENDEFGKKMVSLIMKKIESRSGEEYELWKETRQWSIEQLDKIYSELSIGFVKTYYESEYIENGKKLVDDLLEKNILTRSDGAIIADLQDHKLGILVFYRTDGTALYPVADLPLAIQKFKDFNLKRSIYVVDIRQSLYFKQLFKIISLLGYRQELVHLGYEFVKLPSGMMSSRSGNVITYEELKDQLLKNFIDETSKRHEQWDVEKIRHTAQSLSIATMKFEMLKVGASNAITFDLRQAMEYNGYTAAYLLYTCARINSIFKKADISVPDLSDFVVANEFEAEEHQLLMKINKFPGLVSLAWEQYDPSIIAKYLFELAQLYNDYYHHIPVLKAGSEIKKFRLALLASISQIMHNGLALLGIGMIDEM